jgi:hypothetical protein
MTNKENSRISTLDLIAYAFLTISFAVFLAGLFSVGNVGETVAKTGIIYWFLLALVSAIIPHIKQFKFKDMEIVIREVKRISDEYRKGRDNVWNYVADVLNRVSPETRLEMLRELNRYHLPQNPFMEVADLKRRLYELGMYQKSSSETEEFDSSISEDLVEAILKFQRKYQIRPIDGIVGEYTKEKLLQDTGGGPAKQ